MTDSITAISLFLFLLTNCKSGEPGYSYRTQQKAAQDGGGFVESPSSSFVCLNGNIFEYEIATSEHTQFVNGVEKSRLASYDTLGLYLLKPGAGKYFKISPKGSEIRLVDSGRIDQKKFGLSFHNSPPSGKNIVDPVSFRDTVIDGIKLNMHEEIDSKANDTIVIRYYHFADLPVSSILTYATAKKFTLGKELFRVEFYSKKGSYLYCVTLLDITKLSNVETRQFRKILSQLR